MKILLFSRPGDAPDSGELQQVMHAIRRHGFDYAVNDELATVIEQQLGEKVPRTCRYGRRVGRQPARTALLSYGGDGTLLEAIHRLDGREIPVIGINSGHLGFLTSAPKQGIDRILELIRTDGLRVEPRSMLEVTGSMRRFQRPALAVNEVAIQRSGPGMISVDTWIDDQLVATYHGDGVIVATPTGSTAYSLSVGGPVVAPGCACLIVSPIAPHNLTMRPVVVPDTRRISLTVHTRHAEATVMLDRTTQRIREGATFTVRRADRRFFLALPHNISFYDTLRNKMMWGLDIRG